jgi:hypothetical protein
MHTKEKGMTYYPLPPPRPPRFSTRVHLFLNLHKIKHNKVILQNSHIMATVRANDRKFSEFVLAYIAEFKAAFGLLLKNRESKTCQDLDKLLDERTKAVENVKGWWKNRNTVCAIFNW